MDKIITTYDQLLQEKKRLQKLQREQRGQIQNDWNQLKNELTPVKIAFDILRRLSQYKNRNSLTVKSANLVIDALVARLCKSNYLLRLLLPLFLKKLSYLFADKIAIALKRAMRRYY